MSCIWNLFQTKPKPERKAELRIINPLDLDELPDTKFHLQAHEAAIMDRLTSLHYLIEETKAKIGVAMQKGNADRARELLAKKSILTEKKKLFEKRLRNVQEKLQEI